MSGLRDHVRRDARNVPGVYLMRNAHGQILYVGKSTRLRTRLLSYFRLSWPEHRHAVMLRETSRIEWEETPSEFAALLLEIRYIRQHLPRYNVRSARPLDKWWVVTLDDGPAPRLRVQRASHAAAGRRLQTVVGPFASRAPVVNALRVINDAFGLRDCPDRVSMKMTESVDLFESVGSMQYGRRAACHRYETKRCLGPCVGACTTFEYSTQVGRARAVFEGDDSALQRDLLHDMATSSAEMHYERAGWIRDRLSALEVLAEQLSRMREAISRPDCVYAARGRDGHDHLYLIRNGGVADDAKCSDTEGVKRLELREAMSVSKPRTIVADRLDELLMIEGWFRAHAEERDFTAPSVASALEKLVQPNR